MSASPGPIPVDFDAANNPFLQQFVTMDLAAPSDVEEINKLAFQRCVEAIRQTSQTRTPGGLILHGGIGTGKTHVLSRLRLHLGNMAEAEEPVFVYVLLAAGASRIRRLLRERFVDSLLRPWRGHRSRLEGLLRARTGEQSWEEAAAGLGLGHNMETVLGHVLAGRFPTKTASWLSGESLPENVLESMGLKETAEGDDEDEEHRSFRLIQTLCRIAEPLPVVFCCDQAEALRAEANDRQGFFAYGQLGAAIRNHIPNSVLISSIQTALLEDFRVGIAHEANYQRLGNNVVLEAVNREQGRLLLERRLDAEPVLKAARAGMTKPGLWPIDGKSLDPLFDQSGRVPARRLLHRAAELFEQARHRELTDPGTVESYLEETLAKFERESKAWQDAGHTDAILEHSLPVLSGLLGKRLDSAPGGNVNFHLGGGGGISLCSQANQAAFSRRLGKLAGLRQPSLTLIRDVRLPLKRTAKAAEHMDRLEENRARWVRPTAEAMAALDALRQLHDGYGTLSHRGESVPLTTVAEWLRANLPAPLERLAEELFEASSGFPAERLMEKLTQELVVDAQAAAEWLQVPTEQLIAYAQSHPNQVLLVLGPNPVVCLVAGTSPASTGDAD